MGMVMNKIQLSVFANKAFLDHRHAHSFLHCLWLPYDLRAEPSSCNTDFMSHNTEQIYYVVLIRKTVLTPARDNQYTLSKQKQAP